MTTKTKGRAGWLDDGYALYFKPWRTGTQRGFLANMCTGCFVESLR